MKRNFFSITNSRFYLKSVSALLLMLLVIVSCKKIGFKGNEEQDSNAYNDKTLIVPCGTPLTVNLLAGQNIDIGSVQISNTADSLYITITSEGTWWLKAANVYVGTLSGMPQTANGNPKVGQFPYKKTLNPKKQMVRFAIPLTGLPACYIAAIHVEACRVVNGLVVQTETGWGQGTPMSGGNWAMYVNYCTQTCDPCVYGVISAPFYAGQTIPAGTVQITHDEDSIYVTVNMSSNWYIGHLHVYIGSYQYMPVNPQNTPIPGQFPINMSLPANTQSITVAYSLNGLPNCYVAAVHGEVYRMLNGVTVQSETAWSFGDPFIDTERWGWTTPYCTQECE